MEREPASPVTASPEAASPEAAHGSPTVTPARPRYDYGVRGATAASPAVRISPAKAVGDADAGSVPGWVLGAGLGFLAGFLLLYWRNFQALAIVWGKDPSWSHGFAVPLLAGVLVYLRWEKLAGVAVKGSPVGLALLAYGVGSQVLFAVFGQSHMSNLSMLVVLFGAVLWVLGWDYLKVLWAPVGYLVFMIPPPSTLYVKLTGPMQTLAAEAGVQLLPLFGIEAHRSGTVIEVMRAGVWKELTVAEACSGMRMLLAFVALAVVLAYTTNRPIWQKLLLAGCAVPVAIFCNALRVTLTGVFFVRLGDEWAHGAAHEYLGLAMLAPALGMQLGIAWILDRLFVEVEETGPEGGRA